MNFLRQSTAVDVSIGQFVDATDGVTPETALTISQADVRLKKNNGNFAQKNDASAAAHDENGYYECPLNATDTDTVGILRVAVTEAGALPVWKDFQVVEEAVYDALFVSGAAGYLVPTPTVPVPSQAIYLAGTMQAGSTSTTAVLAAATTIADDLINGRIILYIHTGTGAGQMATVTDWVSVSDTATVSPAWTTTPDNTSQYLGFANPPVVTDVASLPLVKAYSHEGNALALATELSGVVTSLNTLLGRISATVAGYLANNITLPVATSNDQATLLTRTANLIAGLTKIDNMFTAYELDGAVYRFTTNALENAPAGGGGGSADWTAGEKEQIRHRLGLDGTATAPAATPSLALQSSLTTVSNAVVTTGVALSSAAITATLTALKAETQWKTILAGSEGDWTATLPATYPGTGTLILKDKDGVTTRVTQTLTFDSSGRITERASV